VLVHSRDRQADGFLCRAGEGILQFLPFPGQQQRAGCRGPIVVRGISEVEVPTAVDHLRFPLEKFSGDIPMPIIDLKGEHFHYASSGEGLPFLFQHGLGADIAQTLSFGADLMGWRLLAMDCRGHGKTEANLDPGRVSFPQFAEDLAMLLDALGIERVVAGGISMGAGVALALALAHPERVAGLALVRPAWLDRPFPPNLRWFPVAATLLQQYPADEAAQRFERLQEFTELMAESKPAAQSLLGQFRRPRASEWAELLSRMPASVPVTSLTRCQQLRIPVSVVVNAHDPVHPDSLGEELAAAIPGATLTWITSKAESEPRHRAELSLALSSFLGQFK
jgi:pimeloyl-ACP methyl ester carboxylesterase